MAETVRVLSNHINSPVIWMPERKFPGIVMQGDSLKMLQGLLSELRTTLETGNPSVETLDIVQEMDHILAARISIYEATMEEHGLELPY